jgi:juvenile-hormone esterase
VGTEDCLYLNVHVPKSSVKEKKRLPVMVYIHGGGFYSGTGNAGGPSYFMDTEEIVLVTLNYRQGCPLTDISIKLSPNLGET